MRSAIRSFFQNPPDIDSLERNGDTDRLIRLLTDPDPTVQWKAAEALGRMGEPAAKKLIERTHHPNKAFRIGAIEALSDIREKKAVGKLTDLLLTDDSAEVRWASAIALGEIGDMEAIPVLVGSLRDPDKYVRYGSSLALDQLGWIPPTPEDTGYYLAAAQRWEDILSTPGMPAGPFIHHLKDADPDIRAHSVEVIGGLRTPDAAAACDSVLKDPSGEVRWQGILVFPDCGIPLMHLPRGLSRRKRSRKSPYIASFLNFFFLGLGYNYLGFWWGLLLFQVNVTAIVTLALFTKDVMPYGTILPYLLSYIVSAVAVVHTWYYVRGLPDL
ncbi:MAG: HEAT repeat domain-containing protein [Methanomicrobiales archaeon]|nr:HEAT repeat domain-containing protein [Methanomicrobiales archaeon]